MSTAKDIHHKTLYLSVNTSSFSCILEVYSASAAEQGAMYYYDNDLFEHTYCSSFLQHVQPITVYQAPPATIETIQVPLQNKWQTEI